MTSSSILCIPVYRGLTISGNVLERDEHGDVYHAVVSDTTVGAVPVVFVLVTVRRNVNQE